MSNGELKRWLIYSANRTLYAVSKNQRDFVPVTPTIEVMPVEDHERIVAELKTVVEQKDAVVAAAEAMACIVRGKEKTIAMQRRVIEKLREQRDIELEDNCWDDALTGGRPFEQARAMMDAEIEAIEKEET